MLTDWNVLAQMTLGQGDNIYFKEDLGLPTDKIRVLSVKAGGNQNKINFNNLELAIGETPIQVGLSASSSQNQTTNLNPVLNARGAIINLNQEIPSFENFYISTPSLLDIKLLNPAIITNNGQPLFSQGKFKGELILQGKVKSPEIIGELSLNNIGIPSYEMSINSADINFNEKEFIINNSDVNIAGSQIQIKAILANILDLPLIVKKAEITSPSLNIDAITNAFKQPSEPDQSLTDLPPFIVTEGSLYADELIIRNLITTNVLTNFAFSPDWLLNLGNLTLSTAGGSAKGEILYNIQTTELSGSFTAEGMQANAATTTLLNIPNEVYGTLNGDVQFRTRGSNSQELIANANGFGNFSITNGRLVRLGSLEYLLRAVNVLQSGVAGLNINNIIDLIIPQKTGHFEVLEGTVSAKNGVLTTDNITSKGNVLSLSLSGNLDMITNYSDITILGNLSKKVSGLLGPLGSLSINTFIDFIPGLGFLPTPEGRGLIDIIPGLSHIPGLGLDNGKKMRRFVVDINGNLYNPDAVKSFRWVD